MINTIRNLWNHHRIALSAFVVAVAVFGYFSVQTISSTIYWMDPAHQDQTLAGWMTPRYVAQSYKLPPEVFGPALFLVKGETRKRISVGTIAAEHDVTLEELQTRLDAAAAAWRAELAARK